MWILGPPNTAPWRINVAASERPHHSDLHQATVWNGDPQQTSPFYWHFQNTAYVYYYPPSDNGAASVPDVTPHLLPDYHPLWAVIYPTLPVNCHWPHCAPYPYASIYNVTLYRDPTVGTINPPATYPGTGSYNWLDLSGLGAHSLGPGGARAFYLEPIGQNCGPASIPSFGAWCQATNAQGGPEHDNYSIPQTCSVASPYGGFPAVGGAYRLSLEFKNVSGRIPFGSTPSGSNLQSYMVVRRNG